MTRMQKIREVAWVSFVLGCTAFGGPAAHIALLERETVERRGWLSRRQFLDLLGLTNLLPGPNSTEMVIHIGHHRAGTAGLFAAGFCFIVPAAAMTLTLAWAYVRFGALPAVQPWLYGVAPAAAALILWAMGKLARTALAGWEFWTMAVASAGAVLLGVNEIFALLVTGAFGALLTFTKINPPPPEMPSSAPDADTAGQVRNLFLPAFLAPLPTVFGVFFKIGASLYGSGYVLVAFLNEEFVEKRGWLTAQQLLDAVAAGQITPGPLFTTATFVGYQMQGLCGATAATTGIFLPSFLLVLLFAPLLPRLQRNHRFFAAFIQAVAASAVGVMAAVLYEAFVPVVREPYQLGISLLVLLALWRLPRLNPAWLVLGAMAAGTGVYRWVALSLT